MNDIILATAPGSKDSSDDRSLLRDAEQQAVVAEQKLAEARRLLEIEHNVQFQVGEIICFLQDRCGSTARWIAERLDRSESTISTYAANWRAWQHARRSDLSFQVHANVLVAAKRVEQRATKDSGTPYKVDLADALAKTVQLGLKQPHQIVRVLRDEARAKLLPSAVNAANALAARVRSSSEGLLNVPHHRDCLDLLADIPAGSVTVAYMDPPYGDYVHESPLTGGMAGLVDCDNDTSADALRVTCGAIAHLDRILAPGGVGLLWQSARAMRPDIHKAITDAGLTVDICVAWDKGKPQPGYPDSPWSFQWEALYVLRREGESIRNRDGSDRANIVRIPPVRHDRAALEDTHAYEKPAALCEFLVRKHSAPGEIVADLFGCSASFAAAAHRLGRRWIYCESNATNYELGVRRIAGAYRRSIRRWASSGVYALTTSSTTPTPST